MGNKRYSVIGSIFLFMFIKSKQFRDTERFAVYSNGWIGANVFVRGDYEASIFEKALAFTNQAMPDHNKVFVDVGANIGVHSRRMSRYGYETKSFEPNPNSFRLSTLNVGTDCQIFQKALGSVTGVAKIQEHNPRNLGNTEAVQVFDLPENQENLVEQSTLDIECDSFPKIGILKVDVEGQELQVLRGGRNLLVRDRPAVFIEQLKEEFDQQDSTPTIRFLKEQGDSVYSIQSRNILSRALNLALSHFNYQTKLRPRTKFRAGNHWVLVAIYGPSKE